MVKIYTAPYFTNSNLISQRIEKVKGCFPMSKALVMQPFYYGIPAQAEKYILSIAPQSILFTRINHLA